MSRLTWSHWDRGHAIRDGLIYVVWYYGLTWTGIAEAWWLAGLVTLYAAAWWEAANHDAERDYRAAWWWAPWRWSSDEWGDLASSAVGIVLAGGLVRLVETFVGHFII